MNSVGHSESETTGASEFGPSRVIFEGHLCGGSGRKCEDGPGDRGGGRELVAVPCHKVASPNRAGLDRHQQDDDRWILFELQQTLFALDCANTAVNLQARDPSILQNPSQGVQGTQPGCEDEAIFLLSAVRYLNVSIDSVLWPGDEADLLPSFLCCAVLIATAFNLDDMAR